MLVLLLACVATLGGWVLIAPAMPKAGPVVAEPAADIELPRSATLSTAPPIARAAASGATTLSIAALQSTSASAADARDARCGEDQLPVYKTLEPDPVDGGIHPEMPVPDPDGVLRRYPGEIKAAGAGFTGAMARLDAALRASVDPFDHAMADWLDLNLITPPAMRQEELVRDALATSDPRVYALAFAACDQSAWIPSPGQTSRPASVAACARLSPEAWAQLDAGNAEPWLYAMARADSTGDKAAQRVAIERLAESTHLDIRWYAGAASVARQRMRDVDLAAQSGAAMTALTIGTPPFQALTSRCRDRAGGDSALVATCDRIAATFFEQSDTYIGRAIGGSLHRLATGDPTWLDRAHQEQHDHQPALFEPLPGAPPCSAQRAVLAHFVRQDQFGERPAARPPRLSASR